MTINKDNIFYYIYFFFLLLQASQTLIPYSHGDALYYHLVGPKLWKESSWSSMWEDLSHYAQAGYFDLLYFIPTYLIESKLVNQIVCQFIHFFFSIFLGSLFVIYIIKDKVWGPICGIAILTIANDSSFFYYAKNDGALAFFSLVTTYLIVNRKYNKYPVFTGILIGIIPGIKINGFLIILPLILLLTYHLFRKETDFKKYLIIGFLSVISVSPQLLKNYIYTGNPLFPGFTSVMPGNLNQTMLNYYGNHFGNSFELKHFFLQIYDLFSGKAVLILLPFFALFRKGVSNDEASKYLFVGSLIFLLYLFYNGDSLNPRFYFSVYFLLIISVFIYIKNSKINSNKIATIIFILAIIDSKIDLSIKGSYRIIKDYSNLNEKEIINTHIPLTKLWGAIEPATELEYIISDHLSNSYYLPKNIRLHTAIQSLNSDFILKCNDPQEFQKLKKYKYALISRDNQNICYDFILNKGQLMEKIDNHKLYKISIN